MAGVFSKSYFVHNDLLVLLLLYRINMILLVGIHTRYEYELGRL